MSDGPLDTTIAIVGLVGITVFSVYRGQMEIAYAGTAALAAYLGVKGFQRRPGQYSEERHGP